MSTNENIDPETGLSRFSSSPRFTLWVAFFVFTTVTLGAAVEVKNDQVDPTSDAKWAVACSAITFTLTLIIVAMHLHPITSVMIHGTKVEGICLIVMMAFWAVTVSIVSDANNNLAVGVVNNQNPRYSTSGQSNTVLNGNLYYFSWAGFVTSIILSVSYLRSVFGVDVAGELRNRGARLTLWSGMLAGSLIVMGSAVNVYEINCQPMVDSIEAVYCRRTRYAISLGVLGVFNSLAVVGIKLATSSAPFVMEAVSSIFLSIMYAFGVAFITAAKGPGSAIGNLYYFTWISFLCSFMLLSSCYSDYVSLAQPETENDENKNNNNGHIADGFPVETLGMDQQDDI